MNVLIVNSYAGSLTLAATSLGLNVVGSFEDAGYGLEIQRANFPELCYLSRRSQWPEGELDLRDAVVMAHPPCAAFSVQAAFSKKSQGTKAKKFQQTVDVLGYSLRHQPLALMVESVPLALEGARAVHDEFASRYGYSILRILQNAVTFGIAQWRPRFWVVFLRQDACPDLLPVYHEPEFRSVAEVMGEADLGPVDLKLQQQMEKQHAVFQREGLTKRQVDEILAGEDHGRLGPVVKRYLKLDGMDLKDVERKYCHNYQFFSSSMRILDPCGPTSTLMYDSWWWCQGRLLSIDEYKAIMGFPRSYIFPEKYLPKWREFLSRGVCPPVARWVLATVLRWLGKGEAFEDLEPVAFLKPGETVDLTITKKEMPKR